MYNMTTQMTAPTNIRNITVTNGNSVVNAITNITFNIQFTTRHYSGDRVVITMPVDVISGFQCSAGNGLTLVSCQLVNSDMWVTMTFNTQYTGNVSFTIGNITNNWNTQSSNFSMYTLTNDSVQYMRERGSALLAYTMDSMVASVNNDENIVLLSNSTLKIRTSTPFTLTKANISLLQLTINLPTTSFQCLACSTSLGTCSSTSATITISNLTTNFNINI